MGEVAHVERMAPADVPSRGETASMLQAIERMAERQDLDLDRFERLLQMQERLRDREAARLYDEAMSAMQPELPIIGEKGKTDKSTYAKWDDINEQVKPILAKHGFGLTHRTRQEGGRILVTCIVSHRAGHREETTLESSPDKSGSKNDIQSIGSALSYLQRYTAKLLLNLTSRKSDDDDGKSAGGKPTLDAAQLKQLRDALAFRDIPEDRACKRFKVEALEDIYQVDFDACLRIAQAVGGAK